MERSGGPEFTTAGCTARKKRSNTPRRPRTDSHSLPNSFNFSPNDQNTVYASKKNRMDNGGFGDVEAFSRIGSENKLKKVKLKLGGVTRTIHTNSRTDFAKDEVSFPMNGCYSSDVLRSPTIQENIDTSHSCPLDVRKSLHGVPPKDFSARVFGFGDNYSSRGKSSGELFSTKEAFKSDSVRKSKRVPKRRVLDVGFSDEEDDEIRYLGRLNASKVGAMYEDEDGDRKRSHRNGLARLGRYSRTNSTSDKAYEDEDYMEEEELSSDDEPNVERKTLRKESVDLLREGKKEITPNYPNKDNFSGTSETVIDIPTDSLPAPRKKQKEKLSEVEQQLKKVEAAQRRRLQSEKAAREAEAEAIRKILGQDSARKKREEKMKKQRDEAAQGKAASFMTLAPRTVRWVMGPTGTIVTFSEDIGLPSIFNSMPCSYPPPREKCVGPNCTNSYKYRDSKSNLPLCSLLCYRAIHKEVQPLTSC